MSLEGDQLGGYRLGRPLGGGGMGEVYLAEDSREGRQVAIKVIRGQASPYLAPPARDEAARQFKREAQALITLDHPHILPLIGFGEEQRGESTLLYLVMPYCSDGSLARWIQDHAQNGQLTLQQIAHLVSQAADALQYAHKHDIIHQDVKPSNFLVQHHPEALTSPELLLADFGIARLTAATSSTSHSTRGTPAYMAPEQYQGKPEPASDQYGLAVMAYELLTGQPPFQGNPAEIMYQHLQTLPQPPSAIDSHLPKELDAVFAIALAKDPRQRFASISAFGHAFAQVALDNPAAAVEPSAISRPRLATHSATPQAIPATSPIGTTPTINPGFARTTEPTVVASTEALWPSGQNHGSGAHEQTGGRDRLVPGAPVPDGRPAPLPPRAFGPSLKRLQSRRRLLAAGLLVAVLLSGILAVWGARAPGAFTFLGFGRVTPTSVKPTATTGGVVQITNAPGLGVTVTVAPTTASTSTSAPTAQPTVPPRPGATATPTPRPTATPTTIPTSTPTATPTPITTGKLSVTPTQATITCGTNGTTVNLTVNNIGTQSLNYQGSYQENGGALVGLFAPFMGSLNPGASQGGLISVAETNSGQSVIVTFTNLTNGGQVTLTITCQ